jgi:NTE family protein
LNTDKEFGLVLAGGGTKGAYQIGVWKAIKELNIKITAIVGTSIGAINGALFLQDDMKKTEDIYENISINNIMKINRKINEGKDIFSLLNIKNLAIDYAKQKGLENNPLREMIEKNIDIDKIYNSDIDFGLVTYSTKKRVPLRVFKNEIPKEKMVDYLLASSCFPIFKPQKIGDVEYFDGGLYDNVPINLLIEKGYKNIIVADIAGMGFSRRLEKKDIYIKVISPSQQLGGTFEFDHNKIKNNIKLGYLDTMRNLNKLQGHIYYFENDEFMKMLEVFNLNTVYGLEYAAKIYGLDLYRTYKFDEFITELRERHMEAQEKYNLIKKDFNFKKAIQLRKEVNSVLDKGLGLCLAMDLYMDRPTSRITKYFVHYIVAAKAMIELLNYME